MIHKLGHEVRLSRVFLDLCCIFSVVCGHLVLIVRRLAFRFICWMGCPRLLDLLRVCAHRKLPKRKARS